MISIKFYLRITPILVIVYPKFPENFLLFVAFPQIFFQVSSYLNIFFKIYEFLRLFFNLFVKFYQVFLKIFSKYWFRWFLLSLDFIISTYVFTCKRSRNLFWNSSNFLQTFPKLNVKFVKIFSTFHWFVFQNFVIFLEFS